MAFRRKDDHRYRASDSDTRLTRFRPKYKAAHDKGSERELPEICRYCVRAHKLFDSDTMLCERKGVVSCRYTCRKFVYDPLKHVPFQAPAAFDEDMIMPTLDDISDDEPTPPDTAAERQTDSTKESSSAAASEHNDGDPSTAEDKTANAGTSADSAAEKPDGSTVISAEAKPESDGEKTSDGAASEKRSDRSDISADTPRRAEADKIGAAAADGTDGEEKKASQFGMESLWSDTSK